MLRHLDKKILPVDPSVDRVVPGRDLTGRPECGGRERDRMPLAEAFPAELVVVKDVGDARLHRYGTGIERGLGPQAGPVTHKVVLIQVPFASKICIC